MVHKFIYRLVLRGALAWFKAHVWIMSGVKQEGCGLCCGVHIVVILKLCIWEQLIQVILPLTAKDLKVLFKLLVDMLCLLI